MSIYVTVDPIDLQRSMQCLHQAEAEVATMGAVPALVPMPAVMNPVNPPPRRFLLFRASASGVSVCPSTNVFSVRGASAVLQKPQQNIPVTSCSQKSLAV